MRTTTKTAGVNPGSAPAEELVDITVPIPQWMWDAICEESRTEMITTDEVIARALQEGFETSKAVANFEERTGLEVEEMIPLIHRAGIAAVLDHTRESEEITLPLSFAVVPSGTSPVFLSERTVRFVRECCDIAGVDADEWVEGWIVGAHLEAGLNGEYDVTNAGIACDLIEDHFDPEEGGRPAAEKAELYEKFREVAFRYQKELREEAAASEEGGEG